MMWGFSTEEWALPNLRVEKENMGQIPHPWAVVPPGVQSHRGAPVSAQASWETIGAVFSLHIRKNARGRAECRLEMSPDG